MTRRDTVLIQIVARLSSRLTRHTGLSTCWVSAIFIGYGVGAAEDAVLTGAADPATKQYFLEVNLPAHTSFAVIYLASMAMLLAMPLLDWRAGR